LFVVRCLDEPRTTIDELRTKVMKTIKTGTVSSKIKRGDQVVFIAGREYARYESVSHIAEK